MLVIKKVSVEYQCECGTQFWNRYDAAEKLVKAVCPFCSKEWPLYIKLEYKGYEQ